MNYGHVCNLICCYYCCKVCKLAKTIAWPWFYLLIQSLTKNKYFFLRITNEQFVLHCNEHWQIKEGGCGNLKMHWPKVIFTRYRVETKAIQISTKQTSLNDILDEMSWEEPFDKKRSKRHVICVFKMKQCHFC